MEPRVSIDPLEVHIYRCTADRAQRTIVPPHDLGATPTVALHHSNVLAPRSLRVTVGQRWQRGQKQVERPAETTRTIVALPQVRQRWPARS